MKDEPKIVARRVQCVCTISTLPSSLLVSRAKQDPPLEDDGVTLGFTLDDVEDPDSLVGRAGRQSLSVIVHLSIML